MVHSFEIEITLLIGDVNEKCDKLGNLRLGIQQVQIER